MSTKTFIVKTMQTSEGFVINYYMYIAHSTLSVAGSCFSRYFLSLERPGGIALSFACFSFSKINDAVGACVNGLGKCLSSSDTKQNTDHQTLQSITIQQTHSIYRTYYK